MPALLIYLIKANIALTLFYLAYRWGLRKLTFYTLNRFFLLTGIVCASVFPLIEVDALLQRHREIGTVVEYVPDLRLLQAQPAAEFTIWHFLVYVFWTGVVVMSVRFLAQLASLWRLHRQAHGAMIRRQPVKVLDRPVNPFSFFSNIYINPSLHQPAELEAILQHEQVHVRQWHTIDVLAAELNNIFYWFNPGAWLMRTAVRENLEFITDRRMLQQGVDPKAYQYNLIKVSGIPYATAIANNFNFSHLKNRIKMMNSKRSAKYNVLRYVVLGSIVAVALLSLNFSRAAFNGKATAQAADTIIPPSPASPAAPVAPKDRLSPVKTVPPAPTVVLVTPSAPAAPASASGALPALPPAPKAPAAPEGPAAPPSGLPDAPPVPAAPPRPPVPDTLPANMLMLEGNVKPLYIVDGVRKGYVLPASLKKEDIAGISVWKGDKAVARYGEEGRNGVIEITTRQGAAMQPQVVVVKADTVRVRTVISNNLNLNENVDASNRVKVVKLRGVDSTHQPVVVINGKVKPAKALEVIPKDQIKAINVYKGKSATSLYGEKAKNGVIEIRTKDTVNYK